MISCLALFGMGLCLVRPIKAYLVFGGLFVYVLSCLLLLVQARYRTPAVPYLCLFAACGLVFMKEALMRRRIGRLTAGVLTLCLLWGVTHFVYTDEIAAVDQWQQATKVHYQMGGKRLINSGRYEEAIAALEQSIALAPRFSPAYNLRGKAYAILGKLEEAARDFESVIHLSPGQAKGYKNLGFLRLLQGRHEAAIHWLSKALTLAPDDEKVKKALQDLPRE
jgi:tetratricopeptide (TPR) repeat protein